MLLLWSSYTPEPRTGGERFHGTFEGLDGLDIMELWDAPRRKDDDDVIIAWWINHIC